MAFSFDFESSTLWVILIAAGIIVATSVIVDSGLLPERTPEPDAKESA